MPDESRASLLLCAHRSVTVETMSCVMQLILERPGTWRFLARCYDALIGHSRSVLVSTWLRETDDDVFLMVDDDIVFAPEDAGRAVGHVRSGHDIVCGAYPLRGAGSLSLRGLGEADEPMTFGPGQGLSEIRCCGTGFMAVHRRVVEALAETLPTCDDANGQGAYHPFFTPATFAEGEGVLPVLLSEDYAFCELARRHGFRVWVDREAILTHLWTAGVTVYNMAALHDAIGGSSHAKPAEVG